MLATRTLYFYGGIRWSAAIGSLPAKMPEGDVEHDKVLKQWATRILDAYNKEIKRIESLSKSVIRKLTKSVNSSDWLKSLRRK